MQLAAYYDFAKDGSLTPRNGPEFTFTRSDPGLMVDGDGFYREVPANQIRLQGGHWATNQHPDSNDFSTGSYFKLNCTVAQDATDRNGVANNAWSVSGDGLGPGSEEFVGPRGDGLASETTPYLHLTSAYVKAGAVDWVYMYSPDTSHEVWFNIREGYIGTRDPNVQFAGVQPDGNGFYRVWFVSGVENAGSRFYISAAADDGVVGVVNNSVVSDLFYIQDFMVEDVGGKWLAENRHGPDSEAFDNTGDYIQNQATVEYLPDEVGPFGEKNVYKFASDGVAASGAIFLTGNVNVVTEGATRYIASFPVKPNGADWFAVAMTSLDAQNLSVWFNVTTGQVGTVQSDVINAGIVKLKNGWMRCWMEFESSTADTGGQWRYYISEGDNDLSWTDRTDSGDGLLLSSFQCERKKPTQELPGTYVYQPRSDPQSRYFPSNFMATDTDPVTMVSGPCEGMRLDPDRTNIALRSTDMTDAVWNVSSAVVSEQAMLATDARNTAFRLIDINDAASGAVSIGQNIAVATSSVYTWAVDLHKDQNDWAALAAVLFTTPVNSWAYFDLVNGTVGTVDAGIDAAGIIPKGNGWYRCWITFTTDVADGNGFPAVYVADADGDITINRNGTNSIFMKMPQFELGRRPSMPIPTFATSVARDFDRGIGGPSSRISGMPGASVYLDIRFEHSNGSGAALGLRGDTGSETTSGCIAFYSQGTNFRVNMRNPNDTGDNDFTNINAAVDYDDEHRVAICAGTADYRLFNNGSKITDLSEEYATALGNEIDATYIWGTIGSCVLREMRVYNTIFTDAQYEKMTRSENRVFPGYDRKRAAKQKAIDAALWNKAMNARTREADAQSEEDYVPYNNIG